MPLRLTKAPTLPNIEYTANFETVFPLGQIQSLKFCGTRIWIPNPDGEIIVGDLSKFCGVGSATRRNTVKAKIREFFRYAFSV